MYRTRIIFPVFPLYFSEDGKIMFDLPRRSAYLEFMAPIGVTFGLGAWTCGVHHVDLWLIFGVTAIVARIRANP